MIEQRLAETSRGHAAGSDTLVGSESPDPRRTRQVVAHLAAVRMHEPQSAEIVPETLSHDRISSDLLGTSLLARTDKEGDLQGLPATASRA